MVKRCSPTPCALPEHEGRASPGHSGLGKDKKAHQAGDGQAGPGAGLWRGQTQVQHSVGQSSLAGGPALPAFLLTLGSSKTKPMARAQW